MPIKWRSKILLAELESPYGADPAPTGAANAILAVDVTLTPMEGNDVSRDLETSYLGAQQTIPTELHSKLNFKVELSPSGTAGTAPGWGPLLRGCAVAETIVAATSVTYNPVSNNHESLTFHIWIGSTRYVLLGSRGNGAITVNAQGIPYLEFEFTGLFSQPSEVTRVTPSTSGFQKPQLGTSANTPTFTMAGTSFVMRTAKLDLGNAVENRFLIGSESVLITDKSEVFETTLKAVALTGFNPFSLAANQSAVAVSLVHGTGAGKISTLSIPQAQMQRPQGLENAQDIKEWPLRLIPLPTSENDQWTLALT